MLFRLMCVFIFSLFIQIPAFAAVPYSVNVYSDLLVNGVSRVEVELQVDATFLDLKETIRERTEFSFMHLGGMQIFYDGREMLDDTLTLQEGGVNPDTDFNIMYIDLACLCRVVGLGGIVTEIGEAHLADLKGSFLFGAVQTVFNDALDVSKLYLLLDTSTGRFCQLVPDAEEQIQADGDNRFEYIPLTVLGSDQRLRDYVAEEHSIALSKQIITLHYQDLITDEAAGNHGAPSPLQAPKNDDFSTLADILARFPNRSNANVITDSGVA